jgi:hypothetical protein
MSQVYINSGAAATALARFILDNVADTPDEEGVVITQSGPNAIYVSADLTSATIDRDGDTDEV